MTSLSPIGSPTLCVSFALLGTGMAFAVARAFGTRLAILIACGWLVFTGAIAASGWLANFSAVPPHLFLLLAPTLLLTVWLGLSSCGSPLLRLPLAVLIGFQAFRIVVEMLIHEAVSEGIAPVQMTWTGMNFDIVTGITALIVAPFSSRLRKGALIAWNLMGLGLLLWIVGVAVLSMPTVFQRLHPSNTWVAYFPFVWLPTVLVPCALLGHVVLFERLRADKLINTA